VTTDVYAHPGARYAAFRQPDPRIEATIHRALGEAQRVVNVGAGTGSYEPSGRTVVAVEPAPEMIRARRRDAAPCVRGHAESLPFEDGEFDAAMAILTLHHWHDSSRGLRELCRVASAVVVVTFDPDVHNDFWLFRDYFPAVAALPTTRDALAVDTIAELINASCVEPILVPSECTDGFGSAYWRRPAAYLDPAVRHAISAFSFLSEADIGRGVSRLASDLRSGRWLDRYGPLLEKDEFDGGLRLIVCAPT
jgi:SAM-dependent methyltransferase